MMPLILRSKIKLVKFFTLKLKESYIYIYVKVVYMESHDLKFVGKTVLVLVALVFVFAVVGNFFPNNEKAITGNPIRGTVAGAGTQDHTCRPVGDRNGRCNGGLYCDLNSNPPTCNRIRCTDTDNGQNFIVRGNVSGLRSANAPTATSATDTCISPTLLTEFYCAPNGRVHTYVTHNCANEGKVCQNGACVAPPCTDSDGGLNFNQAGVVVGSDGRPLSDECQGNTVIENWCGDNPDGLIRQGSRDCTLDRKVCRNGACV